MFTGIVESIGAVKEVTESSTGEKQFKIQCKIAVDGTQLGDSIAVNGVCLTVTELDSESFKVVASLETLRRTNLGSINQEDGVNIERAMSGLSRFGGHMVQGHVDTTVKILEKRPDGQSIWFKFELPLEYKPLIVTKGYVALDGISLTVCEVDDVLNTFSIMMIPYTQEHVTLSRKKVGEMINFEADCMGKYVVRCFELYGKK